ncbi:hypothetical protein [Helicobacter sp. 12S02232-10]|nr:hypothetical protein [Helicobacter sp. 12S02232-10]
MATRSAIGLEKQYRSIEAVHCHYDGYLDGAGRTLYQIKLKD